MATQQDKQWKVVRTVELNASAKQVWAVVGGFYTIHLWHPDIEKSEIGSDQTEMVEIRRILTFPGQAPTVEELIDMDNTNFWYSYQWHAGHWGEEIKQYHAQISVIELEADKRCLVQWTGHFVYHEDGLTQFYENGFSGLKQIFNA